LSDTDAEPYIAVELGTNANEQARKRRKAPLDLVIGLQHKRSAMWRDAGMCWRLAVVGLLAIVEGRHDPE
jgi:hypothetical protein